METTEIIAALKVAATVDPHQGRGGPEVVVDKKLCAEAADRLEMLNSSNQKLGEMWSDAMLEKDRLEHEKQLWVSLSKCGKTAESPGTNYRKIKNMGPLHFADWLMRTLVPCLCCDKQGICGIPEDEVNDEYCAEHILAWLMQEAENGKSE